MKSLAAPPHGPSTQPAHPRPACGPQVQHDSGRGSVAGVVLCPVSCIDPRDGPGFSHEAPFPATPGWHSGQLEEETAQPELGGSGLHEPWNPDGMGSTGLTSQRGEGHSWEEEEARAEHRRKRVAGGAGGELGRRTVTLTRQP